MDHHEIDQAIYALVAISVFAVVWVVGVLVQLHAEGSEVLSWNSWLEYFCSWSGDLGSRREGQVHNEGRPPILPPTPASTTRAE
jgi:hypothetical protein